MAQIFATPEQLKEARNWVADCVWGDLDADDVAALPERAIIAGVNHHYEGGWRQFVADNFLPEPQGEHYPLWESKSWLQQHSALAATGWRGYDD